MSRRGTIAVTVLVLWLAGLGLLARRELSGGETKRREQAAMLVDPGATYFAVSQGDEQIGFASSTIDTSATGVQLTDYVRADLLTEGKTHRAEARAIAKLTPLLRLSEFTFELSPEIGPLSEHGVVRGDTLILVIKVGDAAADTQRVRLPRTRDLAPTLLLPNLVPLMIALVDRPEVGRQYNYTVFDPMAMTTAAVGVRVAADSLWTVIDSAKVDPVTKRWIPAHDDTVRAYRLEQVGGGLINGWVDVKGRYVQSTQLAAFSMQRTAFELAYTNWSNDVKKGIVRPATRDRDVQENSAIAAAAPIRNKRELPELRVVLRNVSLQGLDLAGGRQSLAGDTLRITRETADKLAAKYALPADRGRFPAELAAEPLLQIRDPGIRELALRLRGDATDPRVVAERINRWVYDSLQKQVSFTLPNAAQVLRQRRGDCNEHMQLFIALARAAGLPARGAAGLAYVSGKFYYHAWPEVYLGDWVAVDPTFNEFPADAAHIRLVSGGLKRYAELLRVIGKLDVQVVQ